VILDTIWVESRQQTEKKNARPENKSRLSDTQIRAKLDLRICYRRREKRVGGGG
jgi:hypothetical protein